jgi:hypothetical protein
MFVQELMLCIQENLKDVKKERRQSMQPSLGKLTEARVLIFRSEDEANRKKYPMQKNEAKELIAEFYNSGMSISVNNVLTSMFAQDISKILARDWDTTSHFQFAVSGDNPVKKTPARVFISSTRLGKDSRLSNEDMKHIQLFKSLTTETPTFGIILCQRPEVKVAAVHSSNSGLEVLTRVKSSLNKRKSYSVKGWCSCVVLLLT